jgi:hypothetical protein
MITQGLIFSCGVAGDYDGCRTYGLVITARCDAANDKVQIYNYLPIVSLNDWLHRDGKSILAERLLSDAIAGLKTLLKTHNFSPAVIETEEPEILVDALFPESATEKPIRAARKTAVEHLARYSMSKRAAGSAPNTKICLQIEERYPKLISSLLAELLNHTVGGYYFLPQIEMDGDDLGFVVLVREIQYLPRRLAMPSSTVSSKIPICPYVIPSQNSKAGYRYPTMKWPCP